MVQCKSLAELSPLISAQIKKGVVTNAAFSAAMFEREIAAGTLYMETVPKRSTEDAQETCADQNGAGGLILLRKREGFWRMSFYLQPDADLSGLSLPPQTVLEIATRAKDVALKQSEELWKSFGFELQFSRQRMELSGDAISGEASAEDVTAPGETGTAGFTIRLASPSDAAAIFALMEENYDRRTACLPTEDELAEDIAAGTVWIAENAVAGDEPDGAARREDDGANKIGRVMGFLRVVKTRRVAEVRQIAVAKDHRGKGIAGELLKNLKPEAGEKGHVWVAQNNTAALKLYENYGFVKDGWTSTVWLYQ